MVRQPLILLVVVGFAFAAQPSCDMDANTKCAGWAKKDECTKNPVWMLPNCAKSCKTCGDSCEDKQVSCKSLKEGGACTNMKAWMTTNCAATCGTCCRDTTPKCPGWARKGECQKNKWMVKNCMKSCKLCGGTSDSGSPGTSGGSGNTGGSTGGSGNTGGSTGGSGNTGGGNVVKPTQPTVRNCDTKGNPQSYWREMDMAVFISPGLSKKWMQQHKKSHQQMISRVKINLKDEMNKLYSYQMLGGVDIKFNMVYVNSLSQDEARYINNKRNSLYGKEQQAAGVAGFCDFQQLIRKRTNGQWDIAMYLVDGDTEGQFLTPGAAGMTRTIEGICSFKKNWYCGIVHGKPIHDNLVFDRLFAHETGHLVGFQHPPQYCNNDMMFSPGQYKKWSQCTVKKAQEIFGDPWKYPCMKYQCGQMPTPTIIPGSVSEADKKVLNQLCTRENKDGQEWEFGAPKGAKGKPNSRYGIQIVLWENPNYHLAKNICKGIPCEAMGGGLNGVTYMEGKQCGVGKTCRGGTCS